MVKKVLAVIFGLFVFFVSPLSVYAQSGANGDANGDGKVDNLDYNIWLGYYGQTVNDGVKSGDFNLNGLVDGIDYTIWLTTYGTVITPPPSQTPGATPGSYETMSIPANRIPKWDAGYRGTIPNVAVCANITNYGGSGLDTSDDSAALKSAITACKTVGGAVFVPAGTYYLAGQFVVPSGVVIRGEGMGKTNFLVTPASGLDVFLAKGSQGSPVSLTQEEAAGSTSLTLASTSSVRVGQNIILVMENSADLYLPDRATARGQIFKVASISGNQITLDAPLRLTYALSVSPRIYPLTTVNNIGFEHFTVKNLVSNGDSSSTIQLSYVENAWIRGVESAYSSEHHLNVQRSRHVTVRDNIVHDSFNFGGGGQAYGIHMDDYSADNLIVNNALYMLRHALITSKGTSGNVYAYNYSTKANSQIDQIGLSDMPMHGGYGYENLFEGNVVEWITLDDAHGMNGPHNTFYRNRTTKAPYSNPTDHYRAGLDFGERSDSANILANTLEGRIDISNTLKDEWIEKNFIIRGGIYGSTTGNTILDNIQGISAATWNLTPSLYFTSPPDFWGNTSWPAVGADVDSKLKTNGQPYNKIPAQLLINF